MIQNNGESQDEDHAESSDEDRAARSELRSRCQAANFKVEEYQGNYIEIELPAGREKRWISLFHINHVQQLLKIPFEKYTFLSNYTAVCSYELGEIECAVRSLSSNSSQFLFRRLFGPAKRDDESSQDNKSTIHLSPVTGSSAPDIYLAPVSDILKSFCQDELPPHQLSIRLSNTRVSQHDQAISLLEKITNSLFFQVELLTGVPLGLVRTRLFRPHGRKRNSNVAEQLEYPKTEFDPAPISLYWYAKSANGMPLLQFLAFYQVIECYFPIYFQAEAHRRIKTILKNPTFRSDRDSDINRLLSAIQVNRSGTVGDERSQLKATLNECVDANELRSFLTESEARSSHFITKIKGVSERKLSIKEPQMDLRHEVAERIYEIRCKIVHTKVDQQSPDMDRILPFSKEADQLHEDVLLIEFISRQVLFAAGTNLKID